jgi:hypothetical protein
MVVSNYDYKGLFTLIFTLGIKFSLSQVINSTSSEEHFPLRIPN